MKNDAAKHMIAEVRGKELSLDELCQKTTEMCQCLLLRALAIQTSAEKHMQAELASMMQDSAGKAFTVAMTDQCFRSNRPARIMDQFRFLLKYFGFPTYLSFPKQMGLKLLQHASYLFPGPCARVLQAMLRQATARVMLPGEQKSLMHHLAKRTTEGICINLNHLGEAILGEQEAEKRVQTYIADLQRKEINYISIKISTLTSQLHLLARTHTMAILKTQLRKLYRIARDQPSLNAFGGSTAKFVNLDMEEYRDLHLTVDAFCEVLSEAEFLNLSAGIVLQSYLPDSFNMQKKITAWALARQQQGGAPIKIRIVKGANLAMEKVEASLHSWPQAPYLSKFECDANYKKMLLYAADNKRAAAVHIGVASHNLFDISFALLLCACHKVEPYFSFEMLEGMADHMRRAVQEVAGGMLLYCPVVEKSEFQNAMAYLIRRLDENSAPENFLHCLFGLQAGSEAWQSQKLQFMQSARAAAEVSTSPRRMQNRWQEVTRLDTAQEFSNEPDTDWSLPHNVEWGNSILKQWQHKQIELIPLVIANENQITLHKAVGRDPSFPKLERYHYCLADSSHIDKALACAEKAFKRFSQTSVTERSQKLALVAQKMREYRGALIGAMVLDGAKTIYEADSEVSEAIDFAEYYRCELEKWASFPDIAWQAKGVVLVAPPWNFPCSIPAGGLLAALATGNTVIFKPAPETVLVGWELVQLFWQAGIDKETLQFINCEDEPTGSQLIKDRRIHTIILTGATATAKAFMKMRPHVDLMAETGGKNSIIVTAMADRDLAIKEIVRSAFGHAGQKCSACSLIILEAEVYDSPLFRRQLKDAAMSLQVSSPWHPAAMVTPLIRPAEGALKRGLESLAENETWLLAPQQDIDNPQLWSPGIKLGVMPGSFMHQTELFGPLLGVMRAENLTEAIAMANGTAYGLTAGLHTLDVREQQQWFAQIEAGNCYINRGITGAIVQRQPFGGYKESSFGTGLKAGGPNYLTQFMHAQQMGMPTERKPIAMPVHLILEILKQIECAPAALNLWQASAESYAYQWENYFKQAHDASKILGQHNFLSYRPLTPAVLRLTGAEKLIDLFRVLAAAMTINMALEVSGQGPVFQQFQRLCASKAALAKNLTLTEESESTFKARLVHKQVNRVRMLERPSDSMQAAFAESCVTLIVQAVLANGRLELLNYFRELSLSADYHRYGNIL